MKRWLMTSLTVFALCSPALQADVTVVQTTTVEGGMAAMGGGAAPSPTTTTKGKGQKSRTDVDIPSMMQIATITDLPAKQVIILRPDQKTATYVSPAGSAASTGAPDCTAADNAPPAARDHSIN